MEFETIWASGTERKVHIEATLGPRDGHFSQSIREMSEIIESNQTKENPISSNKTCKLHTTLIQKTLFAFRQCLPHLKKQGPPLQSCDREFWRNIRHRNSRQRNSRHKSRNSPICRCLHVLAVHLHDASADPRRCMELQKKVEPRHICGGKRFIQNS